ncbi:MAG: hypothetical protein Q8O41_09400 [Candidatus Methanoperedens sp.]|nr:hypothetical protein [Candidatus Methanoperedens sp.]
MSNEKNEVNVVSSSDEETSVRAFVPSAEVLNNIVVELGTVFRTHAPEHSIKVLRGTKGTHPNMIHAVDMVVGLWEEISQDERRRKNVMDRYIHRYLTRMGKERPDVVIKSPAPSQAGKTAAGQAAVVSIPSPAGEVS